MNTMESLAWRGLAWHETVITGDLVQAILVLILGYQRGSTQASSGSRGITHIWLDVFFCEA